MGPMGPEVDVQVDPKVLLVPIRLGTTVHSTRVRIARPVMNPSYPAVNALGNLVITAPITLEAIARLVLATEAAL